MGRTRRRQVLEPTARDKDREEGPRSRETFIQGCSQAQFWAERGWGKRYSTHPPMLISCWNLAPGIPKWNQWTRDAYHHFAALWHAPPPGTQSRWRLIILQPPRVERTAAKKPAVGRRQAGEQGHFHC
jgi:hypothetical protein